MGRRVEEEPRRQRHTFVYRGELPEREEELIANRSPDPNTVNLYLKRGYERYFLVVDFPASQDLEATKPCRGFFEDLDLYQVEGYEEAQKYASVEEVPAQELAVLEERLRRELRELWRVEDYNACRGTRTLRWGHWSYEMYKVPLESLAPIPYYVCDECSESERPYSDRKHGLTITDLLILIEDRAQTFKRELFPRAQDLDAMFEEHKVRA